MVRMIMNLKYCMAVAGALFSLLTACSGRPSATDGISVVAAFYPLEEMVREIGGDRVSVTNLTPAGAEPHDLELTTDALDAVTDADVIFYVGRGFQPPLQEALPDAEGEVVDALDQITLRRGDPHVWLDPSLWAKVVPRIMDALVAADPSGAASFEKRSAAYIDELTDVDRELSEGLSSCRRKLMVTAHEAFGYLAARYGLEQHAIAGVSPEAEPDPKRLASLADLVADEGVTTIFTEELVSPEVADALAREAGVKTAVLDPIESAAPGGYPAAMRRNLEALRDALDCPGR